MKYKVIYDEIFFDRYNLTKDEKKKNAIDIINKAFSEKGIGCTWEDEIITIDYMDLEKEITFDKIVDVLKREFFIFTKEYEEPKEEKKPLLIEECEQYIRKMCLDEGFGVSHACEHFKMKRSTFDSLFVKNYGITAKEYMKRVRTQKAAELIEQGEKMEDVAYLCGFGSVKTMQRAFKSVYGKTPCEYRRGSIDSRETE